MTTDRKEEFKIWNGRYVKELYEVETEDGIVEAWPNAGKMMSTDGSGRVWLPGKCKIRFKNEDIDWEAELKERGIS